MVVFSCYNCGDSVKKPGVEKHYQFKCKSNRISLSCMDCFKNFDETTYQQHTKCITEEQRYSDKNYVPKESNNSGMKKQESWLEVVKSVLQNPSEYQVTTNTQKILQRLQGYENIPRKKTKFINFVQNSLRIKHDQTEDIWNVLEKALIKYKELQQQKHKNKNSVNHKIEKNDETNETIQKDDGNDETIQKDGDQQKQNTKQNEFEKTNTNHDNNKESLHNDENHNNNNMKVKKKRKISDTTVIEQENLNLSVKDQSPTKKKLKQNDDEKPQQLSNGDCDKSVITDEFDWKEIIAKIVEKKSNNGNGIHIDKLKKKVLKKYKQRFNVNEISNKIEKTFYKKLKKSPNLLVNNDIVKLNV